MGFAKVRTLEHSPGCCRFCLGRDDREWFIDCEEVEEYWGRVYICSNCVRDLAGKVGYHTYGKLQEVNETLVKENERLVEDLNRYVDLFSALSNSGVDLFVLLDYLRAKGSVTELSQTTEAVEQRETYTPLELDFGTDFPATKSSGGEAGITFEIDGEGRFDLPSTNQSSFSEFDPDF